MKARFEQIGWFVAARFKPEIISGKPWDFEETYEPYKQSIYGFPTRQAARNYIKGMPKNVFRFKVVRAKITVREI